MKELRAKILLFTCYLRYLKAKSVVNLVLLRISYYTSVMLRKPVMLAVPSYYSIEPVNYCNLACPECPTGNGTMQRPARMIDFDSAVFFVNSIKSQALHINFYFQGEPFLYPQLHLLIQEADRRRIVTAVSSNGHFLSVQRAEDIIRSGLKKLIISLDGYSQESYSRYRRKGEFSKVLETIRVISDAKRRLGTVYPIVCAQVLILSSTELFLREIKRIAYNAGADIVEFKTAQFYALEIREELLPKYSTSRYHRTNNGYIHSGTAKNWCWRAWSNPVVCSDGQIVPCCYDKNAEFAFGIADDAISSNIWHGNKRIRFLGKVLQDRNLIEMCRNCPEGRGIFP